MSRKPIENIIDVVKRIDTGEGLYTDNRDATAQPYNDTERCPILYRFVGKIRIKASIHPHEVVITEDERIRRTAALRADAERMKRIYEALKELGYDTYKRLAPDFNVPEGFSNNRGVYLLYDIPVGRTELVHVTRGHRRVAARSDLFDRVSIGFSHFCSLDDRHDVLV